MNYTAVTARAPKLVYLDVYDENSDIPEDVDIITAATLANEGMDTTFPLDVEYQAVGYMKDNLNIKLKEPLNFCVVDGPAINAVRQLQAVSENLKQSIKQRQRSETIFTSKDAGNDDIIL